MKPSLPPLLLQGGHTETNLNNRNKLLQGTRKTAGQHKRLADPAFLGVPCVFAVCSSMDNLADLSP